MILGNEQKKILFYVVAFPCNYFICSVPERNILCGFSAFLQCFQQHPEQHWPHAAGCPFPVDCVVQRPSPSAFLGNERHLCNGILSTFLLGKGGIVDTSWTWTKCLCLSGSYNASEAKDFAKGKDPFCSLSFIELCLWADSNLMIILQHFCFKNQAIEFKRPGICVGEGV